MDRQCYPNGCQEVDIWQFVTMWSEEDIILISDDEEVQCPDVGDDRNSTQGSSVELVEPQEKSPLEERKLEEKVDEEGDLVVTYCKQANVMPHARHDCPRHPFERAESDTCCALGRNAEICEQCYCYICDKLAAECQLWTVPSLCHCNAHNKSNFWKEQRKFAQAGILATFNLELLELDTELRHGGDLLEKFIKDLSLAYSKYLTGERICFPAQECSCEPKLPPGQCNVCSSKNILVLYKLKSNQNFDHTASLRIAVPFLFQRITTQLQRMLVLCDFPKMLFTKFIEFFQSLSLPCHCYAFSNSLNVLPWDHVLLTTVLRGQNITGQRRQKGRKTYLWEAFPVVEARVEKLLEKKKYKEVVRYLRAVKSNENKRFRDLRDLIPFYLCKAGHFLDAAHSLLFPVNSLACCSACRITPCQFKVYLKIFRTGCVPSGNDMLDTGPWVVAGSPLKNTVLIKQALKLLYSSEALYRNNVLTASSNFLEDLKSGVNVSLPFAIFTGQLHLEASLILAVQAVQQMLYCDLPNLTSFLEIFLAFGKNFWALRLLLDQLCCEEHILCGTANLLLRDLSQEKASMLRVWQNLGPQYVGEFLCLFLTCRHKRMQSVGLVGLSVVMENLHVCPWAKQLCTFFHESGLKQLPFGTTVHHEVYKFISDFEKQ